jgi:hypothetical protein
MLLSGLKLLARFVFKTILSEGRGKGEEMGKR